MRKRTRHYTTELPRITLLHLKVMQRKFAEGVWALQHDTRSGTLFFKASDKGFTVTIGGSTLNLKISSTRVGHGVRYWYLCPHCQARAAILYVGKQTIGCRKCCKLHYEVQSIGNEERLRLQVRRRQLDIWPNKPEHPYIFLKDFINQDNSKPACMRWHTFYMKLLRLRFSEVKYVTVLHDKLRKDFSRLLGMTPEDAEEIFGISNCISLRDDRP
ncbi:hypothetical protein SPM24T3_24032 [Serratia sp. M24T3]|nr:hypothetical protein SPM24T3_24032 [Serratia sp. M24T3]